MAAEAGEIILITYGEYSDSGYIGVFRIIKDFDARAEAERFKDTLEEWEREAYASIDFQKFAAWLVERELIEDITYREWWLGSYGRFEPDRWP